VAGEVIGVGEEIAFEGPCLGIVARDQFSVLAGGGEEVGFGPEACGFDCCGDVEEIEAFRDGDSACVYVALEEAGVDLGERGGVVEAVLAGLEGAAFGGAEEVEGVGAADDAGVGKLLTDGGAGGAGGDVDKGLGRGSEGEIEERGGRELREISSDATLRDWPLPPF
jgi:hypothetical protein